MQELNFLEIAQRIEGLHDELVEGLKSEVEYPDTVRALIKLTEQMIDTIDAA